MQYCNKRGQSQVYLSYAERWQYRRSQYAILRVSESDSKSHLSIAEREQYRHGMSILEGIKLLFSDEITARRW